MKRAVLLQVALFAAVVAAAAAITSRLGGRAAPAEDDTAETETVEGLDDWLRDRASDAGIDFEHATSTGLAFPEIMCGGVAFLDYDGDGDLDLYAVQAGDVAGAPETRPGNRLYRNDGGGSFTDVTTDAGVGDRGYGMGCAVGDYDGDGDLDLYVTNVGADVLYRNDGDGTFTDATEDAGVVNELWGTSAAFFDADADGDLDLMVVNYIRWSVEGDLACFDPQGNRDYCSPITYRSPAPDRFFENVGGGRFKDGTAAWGIDRAFGNGLGLACGDFDGDGFVDVYVANDGTPNQLWMNQGGRAFEDMALVRGCSINMNGAPEAGMGVVTFDLENDGDLDLFLTHLQSESNTCYGNRDGFFQDVTPRTGLARASIPFTSFGLGAADFDHDGHLDLFIANGGVTRKRPFFSESDPYAQPDQLFAGRGDGRFRELGRQVTPFGTSRAAAFGDYDGDGDVDVAVIDRGRTLRLLENQVGDRGQWIAFTLRDRGGREAVGARVGLRAGGRVQWRSLQRAYSYQSSNEGRVHFGLGTAGTVEEVCVRWPGRGTESFGAPAVGAVHELREGTGGPCEGL